MHFLALYPVATKNRVSSFELGAVDMPGHKLRSSANWLTVGAKI